MIVYIKISTKSKHLLIVDLKYFAIALNVWIYCGTYFNAVAMLVIMAVTVCKKQFIQATYIHIAFLITFLRNDHQYLLLKSTKRSRGLKNPG